MLSEIHRQKNVKIFLFGGGSKEIKILENWVKTHPFLTIIAGKLSFSDELSLISNLDVMLSMDSGNAHIAAMLCVKVVTLWVATHPFAGFLPFNQPLENALVSDNAGSPVILPAPAYCTILSHILLLKPELQLTSPGDIAIFSSSILLCKYSIHFCYICNDIIYYWDKRS